MGNRLSRIYTRTGDDGTTGLGDGARVRKDHIRVEAYGTVDELNSYTGLCRDLLSDQHSHSILREIQDRLFTIGSSLACDPQKEPKMKIPDLKEEDIVLLEKEMDRMNEILAPMKSFILPGGHPTVSHLHVARCICRRAERCCVRLELEKEEIESIVIKYLNRLSDYLFILARHTAHLLQVNEIPWKPRL